MTRFLGECGQSGAVWFRSRHLNNMNNDSSNNGQNISGGSDVVARLLNVLVTEVLLKVESRINEQLVSLSNRLTALEREQDELRSAALPQSIGTLSDRLELLQDSMARLPLQIEGAMDTVRFETSAMVKSLDLRIDDLPAYASFRDLRDKLDEIDNRLEDAESDIRDLEDDKVSSDDLEDAIRNAVEVSRSCQDPEAIVRDGLRAMLDGVKI